jgi:hypothetical protein
MLHMNAVDRMGISKYNNNVTTVNDCRVDKMAYQICINSVSNYSLLVSTV